MTTFALVHGAWHGPWCWQYLAEEIRSRGHEAVAIDMPIDTNATLVDYASVVAAAIRTLSDVVLVGHSMAGMVIPLVAEQTSVRKLVYLCGVLRRPGKSLSDDYEEGVSKDMDSPRFTGKWEEAGEGFSRIVPGSEAVESFYADVEPSRAEWAVAKLRKQHTYWTQPNPMQAWPSLETAYVICRDDRAINPSWSSRVVPEWLGIEPVYMDGSHSPFLSRPAELAEMLIGLSL
jgi:pimeloyl-ACP methyl ester carboxylesterase